MSKVDPLSTTNLEAIELIRRQLIQEGISLAGECRWSDSVVMFLVLTIDVLIEQVRTMTIEQRTQEIADDAADPTP